MQVRYDMNAGVGQITLSNPPRNALTHPVFAAEDELTAFLAQPTLKAVLLRGEGRHFSSGADLGQLQEDRADPQALSEALEQGKRLLEVLAYAPVPIVALLRGSCLGAGLEIALACHFRIAASSALLGFPEAEHRLLPGLGGVVWAQGLAPRGALVELLLSARLVGADEAAELGLVDRAVAADRLEDEGRELCQALTADRSALLVHSVMTAIHNARRLPAREALARETVIFRKVAAESSKPERPPPQLAPVRPAEEAD